MLKIGIVDGLGYWFLFDVKIYKCYKMYIVFLYERFFLCFYLLYDDKLVIIIINNWLKLL